MYRWALGLGMAVGLSACAVAEPIDEKTVDLTVDGAPWLRTVITPYAQSHDDETYKVYTHVLDFAGEAPITKGAGGKFPHHRGLFIGWKDTMIDGEDFDTWHMSNCYQQLVEVAANEPGRQQLTVRWYDKSNNEAFIEETRTITAKAGEDGVRIIDFSSELKTLVGAIELKGDLQHAGMQIRMAQEVAEHEASTEYLLPEGAHENDDDEVVGAWWVRGSFDIGGKRYDVVHMTPPSNPGGIPVYSIRPYGRFGAFFEPTLEPGTPLEMHFRFVVSESRLGAEACKALYEAYAAE